MEFSKLTSPSLKDLFIKQMQDAIISGKLSIGEKLPSERELADQMKISRSVVNQGFLELEKKGFVEILPRQGVYVADFKRKGNAETLSAIMDYHGGQLTEDTVLSILEIRKALEHVAVSRFIDIGTEAQMNALGEILGLMGNTSNIREACNFAFKFWHELTFYSGNSIIPIIYYSFQQPMMTLWMRFCRQYGTEALVENTSGLFNYICARDKEGASAWIDKYLNRIISGDRIIYEEQPRKKKTIPLHLHVEDN